MLKGFDPVEGYLGGTKLARWLGTRRTMVLLGHESAAAPTGLELLVETTLSVQTALSARGLAYRASVIGMMVDLALRVASSYWNVIGWRGDIGPMYIVQWLIVNVH